MCGLQLPSKFRRTPFGSPVLALQASLHQSPRHEYLMGPDLGGYRSFASVQARLLVHAPHAYDAAVLMCQLCQLGLSPSHSRLGPGCSDDFFLPKEMPLASSGSLDVWTPEINRFCLSLPRSTSYPTPHFPFWPPPFSALTRPCSSNRQLEGTAALPSLPGSTYSRLASPRLCI